MCFVFNIHHESLKKVCDNSVKARLFRVIKSAESLGTVGALALPGSGTNRSSGVCRRYNTKKRALTLYNVSEHKSMSCDKTIFGQNDITYNVY
jgi:hypothetical protein